MRNVAKFGLLSVGVAVGAAAAMWLSAPAFAVADEGLLETDGIVIGLGGATRLPNGGVEFEVARWVQDGAEVRPVPNVRVVAETVE